MRYTRDEALMATAQVWSERGTCSRLRVGAVVSRNGRILAQGYNGRPAGLSHCDHGCTCLGHGIGGKHYSRCPAVSPCFQAIHAELNAIAWSARNGVHLEGADIHCTDSPCLNCSMAVINAGIKRFVYRSEYRLNDGLELMKEAGLEIEHMPLVIDIIIRK